MAMCSLRTGAARNLRASLLVLLVACSRETRSVPAQTTTPPPQPGKEFIGEAKALSRIVVCAGQDAMPAWIDTALVKTHCEKLAKQTDAYRKRWLDVARPWLAKRQPANLPDKVLYPFGGGDLLAAIAVFPTASEYTAVSLEAMGDPRLLQNPAKFTPRMAEARSLISLLLTGTWNTTIGLASTTEKTVPGELLLDLMALEVHGYEPVSLRYFRMEADGSLHYLEEAELEAGIKAEAAKAGVKKGENELSRSIWNDAELQFRKKGDANAPIKVFRHMARNLSDMGLKGDPLLTHLKAKGKVSAMTKAASHLLWYGYFSELRSYLLANTPWMISDATGIVPATARAAGFTVTGYGKYDTAYFTDKHPEIQDQYRALMTTAEPVPFLFGYFDKKFQRHLVIIARPEKSK